MLTPSKAHVEAAQQLLAQARLGAEEADWATTAGRVHEILESRLAPVLGSAGVRALLARCLKLSHSAHPGLAAIRLRTRPSDNEVHVAEAIVDALASAEPSHQRELATALYAMFFALLTTFIGERLTWQIVQKTFAEDDGTASKGTK